MHHAHGNTEQSREECKLQNSCASTDLAMILLAAGDVGIVRAHSVAATDQFATVVPAAPRGALTRVEFPESPPPRS